MKGGEFIIKQANTSEIFTPEQFDEEQLMIADMCKDFVNTNVFNQLDRIDSLEEGLMSSLVKSAGELGLLGTGLPEEYGGFEKDSITTMIQTEILGSGHSFAVAYAAHTGIGTLPIFYYGTEAQKKKYLPKLASGEWIGAYCLTEPGSGSDARAAKTTAKLSEDGNSYILNGQKMWITNAGFADVFTVFAQVDGDKFTAFIVEKGTEGLSLGNEEHKMGIKGSSTRQVFFTDVVVPKENLLGEIGKGHLIAFNILNIGRLKLGGATLGGAKRALMHSIKYANERQQFKVPISSFGAIKHKLAEQAIRIYTLESSLYRTTSLVAEKKAQMLADGESLEKALLGSAEEYAIECAIIKVFGSEVLDYVTDEGVQIFGGYGFSEDYPMSRSYRDSRINRIFEGTNEINRLLTIDMLIRKAMKGKLDLLSPAKKVQDELMAIPDFGDSPEGILAQEMQYLANARKAILMVAGAAFQQLGARMEQEQEITMNIADMIHELFNAESVILRVKKLIEKDGENKYQIQKQIAQVFLNDAIDRIHLAGKNSINAFAEGDMQRMMLLGLKRFTKTQSFNTVKARRNIADALIKANKYEF